MASYLIFGTISVGLILTGITTSSISVAFPVMTTSFNASLVQSGWILSIYQLACIIIMPLAGKASDIFGKRFTVILSISMFIGGSFLCAIAPNIWSLIIFRFIQGMGGGSFFPVAMGIVAEAFPNKRQQFIGLISSIVPIGQIIGPNLGGWLVPTFGWRSLFWFNTGLAIVVLILVLVLIKTGKREGGHIDLLGTGLLAGGLFGIFIGLSQLENIGKDQSPMSLILAILLIVVGLILMAFLMRTISRSKEPIVDWVVLSGKPFLAANIFNFVLGACYVGISSFIPLYVVSLFGMSTAESGLIMTPWSIGVMISSTITSFFLVRWGYRKPMVIGCTIIATGLSLLACEFQGINILGLHLSVTVLLLGLTFLLGIGLGTALPSSNNACIDLMPERVAGISGVRAMFRNIGGTFGISISTLILNNSSSINAGFTIVYFGLAAFMLLGMPFIFRMPSQPEGQVRLKGTKANV
jgi:EmrB/QacA subfamily drug resistance transporter